MIKMTDDYVAEISMPLTFSSIPADKLLNNTDDRITVRLRANGGDLFSVKYVSGPGKINVNLNQVDLKMSRYFEKYYILSSQLRPQLAERFDFEYTLTKLSPDTIYLDLEDIISKSLPVKPGIVVSCKPQYMIYDSIVSIPSEIMVSGPASVIDTLNYISTVERTISDLDQNTEISIPILVPVQDRKVNYSETEVKLIIPVEQFTESSVDLEVIGKSEDTGIQSIRTFPENVTLTYRVAIKDYDLVKPEMFELSVSYDPQKDMDKTFLKVRIDKSPDFVRITRVNPDKVEFIIQK
jgi:hypothetical protein